MRSGATLTGRRFICNAYAATEAGRAEYHFHCHVERKSGRIRAEQNAIWTHSPAESSIN